MPRRAVLLVLVGCNTVTKPTPCPKPSAAPVQPLQVRMPSEPHYPAALNGHYEVTELKPAGHPAAPPETYLLRPEEQETCAFVRVVLSFEKELLTLRYDTACVDKDKRGENPIPLHWCSTRGSTHVLWGQGGFTLPVAASTRSNVQQIQSYAPGSSEVAHDRLVWSCKFNLDAQTFEVLENTKDRVRLRAVKYDAEWVLKPTGQPDVDPDDVITQLRDVLHKKPEPAAKP